MKNKIINITLGILIVASVGVNVYQYNQNNSMRLEADSIQTEIDNANTNYISLSESISAKGEEITTLGNKIADLEDNLSNLQSTNSSLSTQIADLELTVAEKEDDPLDAEIDSLLNASPSPDTDAAIQDTAQQIIAGYLKEHAQEQQEVVDVPGLTPGDPSQDGSNPYNPNTEVPEHLMGSFH